MNREIKFRGYSEELKSVVYGFYQEVDVEGVGYSYIFWQGNTTPVRADSVAQFTGMYDKNGKEIYEGDVIEKHFEKYEVLFHNCEWVFTKLKDYYKEQFYKLNFFDENNFEIIGNIYENPEFTQSSE